MEIPTFTSAPSSSLSLSSPNSSSLLFYPHYRKRKRFIKIQPQPSSLKWLRIRISGCGGSSPVFCKSSNDNNSSLFGESGFVDVIGIGNRVDPVLDFCLSSLSPSLSLRFWNVISGNSLRGQLYQRFLSKDNRASNVESPINGKPRFKAVVLVATAGYGDDYVIANDVLQSIKSGGGLSVAVVLKPFSFEGQRRRDEVMVLVDKLRNHVNFCLDIDIDTLLKTDLVTLDEALKTAYRAVSSAVGAVSVLVFDMFRKHVHSPRGSVKQITFTEVKKVLNSYKEGKVGFGIGHNVEASIMQAVFDGPFLCMGLKDLDGIVICILSSSCAMGDNDVLEFLRTFRETTECSNEIILSAVHDPDMEPNVISTAIITVGAVERKTDQKSNMLSRLVNSIPLVFGFLRHHARSDNPSNGNVKEDMPPALLRNIVTNDEVPDMVKGTNEQFGMSSHKEMLQEDSIDKEFDDGMDKLGGNLSSSEYNVHSVDGSKDWDREPLKNWNLRLGTRVIEDWAAEDVNVSGAVTVADNPRTFQLPVGVRISDDSRTSESNLWRPAENVASANVKPPTSDAPSISSLNEFTDAGLEAVTEFWNSASTLMKGKHLNVPEKQGVLSARAASMLEAERDSKTRWSPVKEIRYRGGTYKGRCQGGLPEGRGRFSFQDGSVYDGMWRSGKRSGIGSLFFSNGDVFHGSWRDDLMHGKGWLYFHSGERWFANFWKGRANGEGRIYAKSGEVFFGHFQDGWRHGRFLCVKVDGTRYLEIWNQGVLERSEELDF